MVIGPWGGGPGVLTLCQLTRVSVETGENLDTHAMAESKHGGGSSAHHWDMLVSCSPPPQASLV